MAGNFKGVVDHPRIPEKICIHRIKIPVIDLVFIIGLFATSFVHAAEKKDWENPKMLNQNKEAPHATLMPFSSVEKAVNN